MEPSSQETGAARSSQERKGAAKVFLSYGNRDPDKDLAHLFFRELAAAGHHPFMADESIAIGDHWPSSIDQAMAAADYLLLFLSGDAANSEMVTEEVKRAKLLLDSSHGVKPRILPVRVRLPFEVTLNYDLAGYLSSLQQRSWNGPADTPALLAEVLSVLAHRAGFAAEEARPAPLAHHELDPAAPPAPIAAPELPEGQVKIASAFYVERPPMEALCYELIEQPYALIRIKAPRQMGKTSLLARTLDHARAQGLRQTSLSFQLADSTIASNLNDLLRWLCSAVTWKLDLPDHVAEHWDKPGAHGAKFRCTAYFQRYLLARIECPLVLGLDEVDLVFQHPEVANDFFGMLRAWHELAKEDSQWSKLRLIIVHSTEVYIPLRINESPFNVGFGIDLKEFEALQVLELARRHGLSWQARQVERLMAMVGGHPFLVRVALYHIARSEVSLDELLATAAGDNAIYRDHLRRHLWNLEQHPALAAAMRRVVTADGPVQLNSEDAFKLDSMGLVRRQGRAVSPRCNLYRLFLADWLRETS